MAPRAITTVCVFREVSPPRLRLYRIWRAWNDYRSVALGLPNYRPRSEDTCVKQRDTFANEDYILASHTISSYICMCIYVLTHVQLRNTDGNSSARIGAEISFTLKYIRPTTKARCFICVLRSWKTVDHMLMLLCEINLRGYPLTINMTLNSVILLYVSFVRIILHDSFAVLSVTYIV